MTIVRRQIKKNHAGHHGGAWKVAFADFTLAMMALFMTLWIVNSVSKSERESIIAALHGQSIFNGGGLSPLNKITPTRKALNRLLSRYRKRRRKKRAT